MTIEPGFSNGSYIVRSAGITYVVSVAPNSTWADVESAAREKRTYLLKIAREARKIAREARI